MERGSRSGQLSSAAPTHTTAWGRLGWQGIHYGTRRQGRAVGQGMQAGQSGMSGGGSGAAGLMSSVGADGRLPPAAAGRRGIPRRSISWSWTETIARAAAIRSCAGAFGSRQSSPRLSAVRRSRRTIWPGNDALARLNTTPLLAALRDRLFPSVAGYDFSMYGMTTQCDFRQRFQPMFTALRSRS